MNPVLAAQADLATIKEHLKMAFVMEMYGHTPELQDTNGKLHYISPFRDDEHPSFDIFSHLIKGRTEPEERYADHGHPELGQGDVVDLVGLFEACSHSMALDKSRDLLVKQLETNWQGPVVQRSEMHVLDMDEVQHYIDNGRDLTGREIMLNLARTHPGLTDVVLPMDRVFLHPSLDVIVFLLLDENGEVRGVRHRKADGKKYGLKGGKNILMRLEDPSSKPVFLTEGETDLWAAWGALHETFEVVGVPGVGTTPAKAGADHLAGRQVYIAFDPDEAGERGRTVWADYLTSVGCSVHVVILPEGKDIAKLSAERIVELPDRARSLKPAPEDWVRRGNEFGVLRPPDRDGEQRFDPKTNWSFIPKKLLVAHDNSQSYQGTLLPDEKTVVLPASSLNSSSAIKSWGVPYSAHWFGSDPNVQKLGAFLTHESAYLPEGRIHNQVGLYEGSFVWPGGYIGEQAVEYGSTIAEADLSHAIFLKDKPVDVLEVLATMIGTQHRAAITPIMAWLAVAPLRTRFTRELSGSSQFPILNISGGSGSGKSTLTEELLRVFTSSTIGMTLTSTTPHAVSTTIDNSCGFPTWFDEYRPGAKQDTKERLDQSMRDAFTAQPSAKGGQDRSNLSKITNLRTDAPIIVTGEDSFSEESHTERMVPVRVKIAEQGNLDALKALDTEGFGYAYLKFLTSQRRQFVFDDDPTPPVLERPRLTTPSGYEVKDRPERTLRVLQYGWDLLRDFAASHTSSGIIEVWPELDLSRIVDEYQRAAQSDPTTELIKACLENDTLNDTVWRGSDYLCVSPNNLITEARNYPSIVLPYSSSQALKAYLLEKYPNSSYTQAAISSAPGAKRVRVIRIPIDELQWYNDEGQD